jgi:diguanylate cyclase (GGDEF)-like protein
MQSGPSRFSGKMAKVISAATARESIAALIAVAISLAIITTIYSNIRSVEQALPRFGFLSFRELHVHLRDIDRLKDMVVLARSDPSSRQSRELLAEAADLAYIRFVRVDRTRITSELDAYAQLRDHVIAIVDTIDTMQALPGPLDQNILNTMTRELERVEAELNRLYFSVGEDSSEGLHDAQLALGALNTQILVILAILSTLLIGVAILLVQRQRAAKVLRRLAWQDSVTGLKNRAWLMENGSKFISGAKVSSRPLAIYLIDLDHFKQVNDTFGHQAGDGLLREVASVLESHNRPGASVSIRLGGDEFAFAKVADSRQELVRFGELLCTQLSGFREIDGHQIRLAASIGLSFCPDHGSDISTLLRHADLALYSAKADGRQRAATYSPEMKANLDNRVLMEENIRQAIQNDDFYLVWQPQLSVSSGRLTGAEALLRWNEPGSATTLQPQDFIPVAEKSDLILEINKMVLRKACFQAADWVPHLPDGFSISVNISGKQLENRDICDLLAGLLKETGLPAALLELEVTERVFIQNKAVALAVLAEIRQLGVRIALDDFGTGYSSLGSITDLEIDRIKIDRSFLSQLADSPRKQGMVNSILTMCQALELDAVAEGVESADQLDYLAGTGCAYAQGYYISEPLSASIFSNYIMGQRLKNDDAATATEIRA